MPADFVNFDGAFVDFDAVETAKIDYFRVESRRLFWTFEIAEIVVEFGVADLCCFAGFVDSSNFDDL